MQKPLPRNLPPLVEPQPLPADPAACRLREISGWWLEIKCGCGALTNYPLRLMAGEQPNNPTLGEVLPRLRCGRCHARPDSVKLIESTGANWSGIAPRTHALPLPWRS